MSNLAIIIPTLNEEHYIGKLLDSIASQTLLPKEIIVVDAESEDKTIDEIQKRQKSLHQLKYYQIPKYTISRQRNFGVKKTKSEHILFLDADVILRDKRVLEDYMKGVEKERPDVALAQNVPDSKDWRDKGIFKFGYVMMKATRPIWPTSVAINMYVKRKSFEKVGGFNEEIKVAEDFEFVQRMYKNGYKFIIFNKPQVHSSVRRWKKYGRLTTMAVMWTSLFLIFLVGYKKNPVKHVYKFGKHDPV
jgi:glycosyltransferase involved in cell wall biosynthesis